MTTGSKGEIGDHCSIFNTFHCSEFKTIILFLVPSCSPTGNKPDSSPRVPRMTFLLSKQDNSAPPRSPKHEAKDESSPPKSPWGINIMKKAKKASPKAFGVRLEDCQPATNNKVCPFCSVLNVFLLLTDKFRLVCLRVYCLCSSFPKLWRSAVGWWRTWVWSIQGSTECQETMQ